MRDEIIMAMERSLHGWGMPMAKIEACISRVQQSYSEPHRVYHNQDRLNQVVTSIKNTVSSEALLNPALILAIAYHDVIYDPAKTDNEYQSAKLLIQEMSSLGYEDNDQVDRAARWIEATKHHDSNKAPALFLDADMSILACPPEDYAEYSWNVREEYLQVFELKDFLRGRIEFLESSLSKANIFSSVPYRMRHESDARTNMTLELGFIKREFAKA